MIISTLRIMPSAKQRRETLEMLRSVQGPTLAYPGCVSCRIYEEHGPDRAILFYERWESEAAFQEHVRSDLYHHVLAAVELSNRPPEICFHHVSATQGMDLIENLRDGSGPASSSNPADTATQQ